ncbi:hypothetical protein ABT126_45260 [Streptomyces sp. NPDC002012]|uniref:hypothetical protein n=1 Tax=Streptomyces sp. NPDC002012 TaxID=3154532 RepID=UPI003326C30F
MLTKPSKALSGAFERGVAAWDKLGVFLSNTKSRRAKLAASKLQGLAELGLDWAA